MKVDDRLAARSIPREIERLRAADGRLTLEVWDDGRCKLSCSTAMRIAGCREVLETLRAIPGDAPWRTIWEELFDFPEAPV